LLDSRVLVGRIFLLGCLGQRSLYSCRSSHLFSCSVRSVLLSGQYRVPRAAMLFRHSGDATSDLSELLASSRAGQERKKMIPNTVRSANSALPMRSRRPRCFGDQIGAVLVLPRTWQAVCSKSACSCPTPETMQQLFEVAAKYGYWLASPAENAAIGLNIV